MWCLVNDAASGEYDLNIDANCIINSSFSPNSNPGLIKSTAVGILFIYNIKIKCIIHITKF